MLRKFKISIDGKEYLVEMEEIGGVPQAPVATPAAPTAPAVEAAPTPTPVEQAAPEKSTPAGNDAMPSPMPGTILKILVNVGDTVQENQPLMILEAMKMENEIVAGKSGTVTGIHVQQGDMVNPGEPLITIN
ncbi:acetyl-CoA carboxylase biotin carboxyl carrier protein subunit [Candidatus Enterococcus ikei]|uniref:Acetyl-CoA carboxylase biotin carboxyl carrier protein subunit n=1 Tax=Candidatus Enterococcus ikei TaxID=2815326 RepID=A0ABS3H0C7_9ENTE|nr:acetyl-CoA carboxylase biotin carboxyl carrier protein subunit [Enterococcus sp. DIV0869a]MBO0440639.1 acetyl-CoA carboxylase biotin carboxyl carrier protein subunit [Enterococcus sp. DIV0869a]